MTHVHTSQITTCKKFTMNLVHVHVCEGGGENRNIWRTFAHFDLLPTLKEGHPPLLIAKTRRPADAQKPLYRAAKPCGHGLALRWNLLCFSRDARPQELPAFSKQSSCKHFDPLVFCPAHPRGFAWPSTVPHAPRLADITTKRRHRLPALSDAEQYFLLLGNEHAAGIDCAPCQYMSATPAARKHQ